MFQMVNAKAHCRRSEVWKIRDHADHLVPAWAPENEVVSGIMDNDVIGVIGERANAESDQQTEPPITKTQMPHAKRDAGLNAYDRDRYQRSPWIAHHQLANLGMGFDDSARPPGVRLIGIGLVKRRLHYSHKVMHGRRRLKRAFQACGKPSRLTH